MQLIPVIDLKGGIVVHARRGARDTYAPLASPLSASAAAADVVAGFLRLAPFRTLYIADLDAITGTGDNAAVIAGLRRAFPALELWVDAGETTVAAVRARAAAGLGVSVVGTESLPQGAEDIAATRAVLAEDVVLSLDHDGAGPLGPRAVHQDASLWPARVIVMTLARVGADAGPDLATLAAVAARRRAGLFAAGGVRGPRDLDALAAAGASGVLVASALHSGRIGGSGPVQPAA
ncbi:HisA/HisF-related TIM barrel protein [Xanthobacter sp. V4C-4]|uniref:HisA/HisF-related TIM barrel protein n=1 Tax=Xanthobacter cornucopiae TaxID=3119924 RepID=UPI00372B1719